MSKKVICVYFGNEFEVEASTSLEAAFIFSKQNINFFKNWTFDKFNKLPSYWKYWGLVIDNVDYGSFYFEVHKKEIREFVKSRELGKRKNKNLRG